MKKPDVVFTDSRHIPIPIRQYVDWRDEGVCVTPGCQETEALEYDHVPCWNTWPKGLRRHDPDKIFLRCKMHHKAKSAVDTSESARSKRIGAKDRGEWRKTKNPLPKGRKLPTGRKLQSRNDLRKRK